MKSSQVAFGAAKGLCRWQSAFLITSKEGSIVER